MKSLADFKRRLQVGVKLACVYHQEFAGRDEKGMTQYKDIERPVREVSIVQSNSFALKTQKTDGSWQDQWCDMPKASQVDFPDQDTIVIKEPDFRIREGEQPLIPILTYKFV